MDIIYFSLLLKGTLFVSLLRYITEFYDSGGTSCLLLYKMSCINTCLWVYGNICKD